MKIIIANSSQYYKKNEQISFQDSKTESFFITRQSDLNIDYLRSIAPDYIFFMHWSYIIPEEIYSNFKCVIFHMTDLPFGRGGSPLQNLISRKIYNTKISAIQCVKEIDAGDIYLQKDFDLYGSAQEIYLRASNLIIDMINEIIQTNPKLKKQIGEPVVFKRRKPKDGDISQFSDLLSVFDYIRMLDADGYPRAFIETKNLVFEFERASFRGDEIIADVKIRLKK